MTDTKKKRKLTKENANEQYEKYQKKRAGKRRFVEKPVPKCVSQEKTAFVKVIKKYGRFNKEAQKKGWLKNPVLQSDEPYFEVHDITSGGHMRELSPMVLGPVIDLHGDAIALNIEDGWQGSKVSEMHMYKDGKFDPKAKLLWKNDSDSKIDWQTSDEWIPEWKKWSEFICLSGEALRRRVLLENPTENKPNPNATLFSYYRGKKMPYYIARKVMYIPWYAKLARETKAFEYLKKRFDAGVSLILLDTDGEPRDNKIDSLTPDNLRKRINDPNQIFGHGFVLAAMLLDCDVWSD